MLVASFDSKSFCSYCWSTTVYNDLQRLSVVYYDVGIMQGFGTWNGIRGQYEAQTKGKFFYSEPIGDI